MWILVYTWAVEFNPKAWKCARFRHSADILSQFSDDICQLGDRGSATGPSAFISSQPHVPQVEHHHDPHYPDDHHHHHDRHDPNMIFSFRSGPAPFPILWPSSTKTTLILVLRIVVGTTHPSFLLFQTISIYIYINSATIYISHRDHYPSTFPPAGQQSQLLWSTRSEWWAWRDHGIHQNYVGELQAFLSSWWPGPSANLLSTPRLASSCRLSSSPS